MGCSIPINISGGESFSGSGGWGKRRNPRGFVESRRLVPILLLLSGAYIIIYDWYHIFILYYYFIAPGVRDSKRVDATSSNTQSHRRIFKHFQKRSPHTQNRRNRIALQ